MKKLILLLFGFILGALAMYFYCCKEEPITTLPTPPKGLIKPAEAIVLDTTYNSRYKLISDSIVTRKGGDNRSSWFSKEELEGYLTYAKNQAGEMKYTLTGFRIYAGAEPEDAEGPGYTTYFIMPTGYKNTSEGSMLMFQKSGKDDINGADGLNHGTEGQPPGANYPQ